ncbi:hypothetical protein J2T17_004687 [Paenibacillus mucilaginosus]|uniref:hypothetical protein n=1 Tax=Paenibacillus mucilaginosus TaxID=61624 RepID=UPI003D258A14
MEHRFEPKEVTYANTAILRLSDGRIAAGTTLSLRRREDGRTWHDEYRLISRVYQGSSIRAVLPLICGDILDEVTPLTKLVCYRSFARHYEKNRELTEKIGALAAERGIDVRFSYIPALRSVRPNLPIRLIDDMLRRERNEKKSEGGTDSEF